MTTNNPATDMAVPNTDDDQFWNALDAKDVYFTDDPPGDLDMEVKVPWAFANAGYKIRSWGKAQTHPVWILRARRKSAPQFAENAQFVAHVREVLRSAGVRARKGDVTIGRKGDTIHVSFVWPQGVRAWRFDEELGWAPDPPAT